MPKPPQFDGFFDLKFITNYLLAGCEAPFDLIVDFSQEPLKDVALLFLEPDISDIVQGIFQPRNERHRKSARHGKKRARSRGIPDPNDLIANKIRGRINPYDALNFGPLRKVFRLWNVYEGINFTAAVADGITDVGFETLWGIINVNADKCYDFPRISRRQSSYQIAGGAGPYFQTSGMGVLEFNRGFQDQAFLTRCPSSPYQIGVSATIVGRDEFEPVHGRLALAHSGSDVVAESGRFSLDYGEALHIDISYAAEQNELISWGFSDRDGFWGITEFRAFAFAQVGWL